MIGKLGTSNARLRNLDIFKLIVWYQYQHVTLKTFYFTDCWLIFLYYWHRQTQNSFSHINQRTHSQFLGVVEAVVKIYKKIKNRNRLFLLQPTWTCSYFSENLLPRCCKPALSSSRSVHYIKSYKFSKNVFWWSRAAIRAVRSQ